MRASHAPRRCGVCGGRAVASVGLQCIYGGVLCVLSLGVGLHGGLRDDEGGLDVVHMAGVPIPIMAVSFDERICTQGREVVMQPPVVP